LKKVKSERLKTEEKPEMRLTAPPSRAVGQFRFNVTCCREIKGRSGGDDPEHTGKNGRSGRRNISTFRLDLKSEIINGKE